MSKLTASATTTKLIASAIYSVYFAVLGLPILSVCLVSNGISKIMRMFLAISNE
ncbi:MULTISPECIES: hypothetical protein [unclassified Enterococcus]|uniref:hypothetical protein n=1 Tax=unclassified Enterococcus TaxID=2608891 RepID=UPI001C6150BE|nr:hypothetical protein [Enterococcus sp. PF-3]